MTKLAELEQALIESTDPQEHAAIRQEIREQGLTHLADALDRIAERPTE